MHGPEWLANPVISIILMIVGFLFLYLALRTEKEHRRHQHHEEHSGIETELWRKKVVDTSRGWLFFTLFIGGEALGAHFLSECFGEMYLHASFHQAD